MRTVAEQVKVQDQFVWEHTTLSIQGTYVETRV
jgi:hypothetical protein